MIAFLVLAAALEVRATVSAAPTAVEIGQPVVITLVVEHPASTAVEMPKPTIGEVAGSWMFVEEIGRSSRKVGADVVDSASWSAFALEGGVALPPFEVSFTVDGVAQKVVAQAGEIAVASALEQGEDAARASKPLREPTEWVDRGALLVPVGVPVAVVLFVVAPLALVLVRRARRRRLAAGGAQAPKPLEQLARIAAEPRQDTDANREVLYSVTWIVRGAVDAHVGEARAARTDSEWLDLVSNDARVPEGARAAARRLLERAERVKYAGETPSRFATDEALSDARAIVEALQPARPAA